jgi:hypothetical protein
MKSCFEALEVRWTPTVSEAYMIIGSWVIAGRLCVRKGQYAPVVLMDEVIERATAPQIDQTYLLVCVDGSPAKAVMFRSDFWLYDEGQWYIEGEQVYCAKIAECEDFGGAHYWLVLKCLDTEGHVCQRIGLVTDRCAKWPCEESKRTIRVV